MTRDREARNGLQVSQGIIQPAGFHFGRAATPFALEVVVMVARVASNKPHDLVGAEDALCPSFMDESFQIPIHRG